MNRAWWQKTSGITGGIVIALCMAVWIAGASEASQVVGPKPIQPVERTKSVAKVLQSNEMVTLTALDGSPGAELGCAVAVDGDTAVVGACRDSENSTDAGAVYIYRRNHGGPDAWGQLIKLTAADGAAGDMFGYSVAIHQDLIVAGAPGHSSASGAAYVFGRDQGGPDAWGQVAKLTDTAGQPLEELGVSVALFSELVAVGIHHGEVGGVDQGSVLLFHRNQGGVDAWGQVTRLVASDGVGNDQFGFSVDTHLDLVLVGAPGTNSGTGAAYLFRLNQGGAGAWGQIAKLIASDAISEQQLGFSVAVSSDLAVVGAYDAREEGDCPGCGAAYVFARNSGGSDAWGELTRLSPSAIEPDAHFGLSVDVTGDHTIAAGSIAGEGRVYLFSRNMLGTDGWGEVEVLTSENGGLGDLLGAAVAIGPRVIIAGAPGDDDLGTDAGSAVLYSRSADAWREDTFNYGWGNLGSSVSIDGDTMVAGQPYFDNYRGSVSIYKRNQDGADKWQKYTGFHSSDYEEREYFGSAVALHGDTLVVGAPGSADVYVYYRNAGGEDSWGEVTNLIPSGETKWYGYGERVAIFGDLIAVSDPERPDGGPIHLYERNQGGADVWGTVARLTASTGDDLYAVACTERLVAATAVGYSGTSGERGAVFLYERDYGGPGNWGEMAIIEGPIPTSSPFFGNSIALSGDTLAVGAGRADGVVTGSGAVYLYRRNLGGTNAWGLLGTVSASDGEFGDLFGLSIDLENDVLVVGAPYKNNERGVVYVYHRNHGGPDNWGEVASWLDWGRFGSDVDLSGNHLAIGAHEASSGDGKVFVYQYRLPETDLSVLLNLLGSKTPGGTQTYRASISNLGLDDVANVHMSITIPEELTNASWTCTPGYLSSCTESGTGDVNDIVSVAAGSTNKWAITGTLAGDAMGWIDAVATATEPSDVIDMNPANNTTTFSYRAWAYDYGDAPDPSYDTLGGPRHWILPELYLGSSIDSESDGQPSADCSGDDNNGDDDEDGVVLTSDLLPGSTATVEVTVSANGLLNGWIDFDGDGDWDDPADQIFSNTDVTAGLNQLSFQTPSGVPGGLTAARFRLSSSELSSYSGTANDGELEDYQFEIIDVQNPVNPTITSSSHTAGTWSGVPVINLEWYGADDGGSGLSGYSVLIDSAQDTEPDNQIDVIHDSDPHTWTSDPLADGSNYYAHLRTCDQAGNCSNAVHLGPFLIDTTPPDENPMAMDSTSHTPCVWSDDNQLVIEWSGAHDNGSGVGGYSVVFDTSPTTDPDDMTEITHANDPHTTSAILADGSAHYFHLRTCDAVGSCTASSTHLGPFWLSASQPGAITAPTSVCSGSTGHTASVADAGPGATYTWSISNGSITAGDNTTSITFDAATSGSVGLSVTVATAEGCTNEGTANVTIDQLPDTSISAPASVCPGSTGHTASVPDAGPGATYSWSISNGTITAGSGTRTVTFDAASSIVELSVTVETAAGCSSTDTQSVSLYQTPDATISAPSSVCANSSENIASVPDAGPGATYTWSINRGTITGGHGTNTINFSVGITEPVVLTVTVESAEGCSESGSKDVAIDPLPTVNITAPSSVCAGSSGHTASVADAGPGASYDWSITNGTITAGNGTRSITFDSANSDPVGLSVSVQSAAGCSTSKTRTVAIDQLPDATISAPTSICTGSTRSASVAYAGTDATYTWSISNGTITSGDGTRSIIFSADTSEPVGLTVTVFNAVGCSASGSATVTVNTTPDATITAPATTCPLTSGISASVADAGPGATYVWSINKGSITSGQGTPSIVFSTADTTYTSLYVNVTTAEGCNDVDGHTIYNYTPVDVTINAADMVCSGSTGNTAFTWAAGAGSEAVYTWSITNGTITSGLGTRTITFDAGTEGSVDLSLHVIPQYGCEQSDDHSIPINPRAYATITAPASVCASSTGNIATVTDNGADATYDWSISNGTITAGAGSQTITFSADSTGPVVLSATVAVPGGCEASDSWNMSVNPAPDASISPPSNVCAGTTGHNASVADAGTGAAYSWSIINGTITAGAGTSMITFDAGVDGMMDLSATVTTAVGCSDTKNRHVYAYLVPDATITAPTEVCPGSTSNFATVPYAGSGASYSWSISNGTITQNTGTDIMFTAGSSGSVGLSVTVTSTDGCSADGSQTITIDTAPNTSISAPTSVCAGSTGNTASVPDHGSGASYHWMITNGTITAGKYTPTVTFTAGSGPVGLTITVTTAVGCASSSSQTVPIDALPTASITAPTGVCAGSTGHTASVPAAGAGATYTWSISNGTITSGNGTSAITFNAGTSGSVGLSVTVETAAGCSSSGSQSLPINPLPAATITAPAAVCAGTSGHGASVPSAGAGASYSWTITNGTITAGNGTSSIVFTAGSSGPVSLGVTVQTAAGCAVSGSRQVVVNALPDSTITAPASVKKNSKWNPASVPNAGAGATYSWSISNGTITSGQGTRAIEFTAGNRGTLTLQTTVTNANGCSSQGTKNVTVN